jgi:hypothetical protein
LIFFLAKAVVKICTGLDRQDRARSTVLSSVNTGLSGVLS